MHQEKGGGVLKKGQKEAGESNARGAAQGRQQDERCGGCHVMMRISLQLERAGQAAGGGFASQCVSALQQPVNV